MEKVTDVSAKTPLAIEVRGARVHNLKNIDIAVYRPASWSRSAEYRDLENLHWRWESFTLRAPAVTWKLYPRTRVGACPTLLGRQSIPSGMFPRHSHYVNVRVCRGSGPPSGHRQSC